MAEDLSQRLGRVAQTRAASRGAVHDEVIAIPGSVSVPISKPGVPSTAQDTESTDLDEAFEPGTRIGDYVLLNLIGTGGVGRVYRGQHAGTGREVAIKVLRGRHAENARVIARFFDEAHAVKDIAHDHIVRIDDFILGQRQAGAFMVMEFLRGASLNVVANSQVLPVYRCINIMMQVCSAVQAVHDAGIVHRDLKPENIFLTLTGDKGDFVKLVDFGVAKLSNAQRVAKTTEMGIVVGTPEYMSPEQACGQKVDGRTDVYAAGAILYEILTGTNPFQAEDIQGILMKQVTHTPPPPSSVAGLPQPIPRALDDLVMRCLAKRPEDRPATMREVEQALREIREVLPKTQSAAFAPRASRPRQSRWLVAMLLVSLIALGATNYSWLRGVVKPMAAAIAPAPKPLPPPLTMRLFPELPEPVGNGRVPAHEQCDP